MGARNSSTLKIIPVCGHVMFLEIMPRLRQGSLILFETFGATCRLSYFSFVQPLACSDFVIVKDFLEFLVSKFGWHPFYNESLAFFLEFGRLWVDKTLVLA